MEDKEQVAEGVWFSRAKPWLRGRRLVALVAGLTALVPIWGACNVPRLAPDVQAEADWHDLTWQRAADVYHRFSPSGDFLLPPTVEDQQPPPSHGERKQLEADAVACRSKIDSARATASLPGAPKLEENRAYVLARGKAEPVFFVAQPQFQGEVSRGMTAHRQRIMQTLFPRDVVLQLLKQFRHYPEHLRTLLLRDGYFYTDDAAVAREVTVRIGFEDLFDAPRLEMMRGSRSYSLQRKKGVYYFADGEYAGQRARLLLFDRVWIPGQEPGPPLHVDVRELAYREGFSQMRIDHMGKDALVAELRYSGEWIPAYIERNGTELTLDCLLIEPEDANQLGRARDEAARRAAVVDALRRAITEQVREGLPFDEPRTEVGQQDGKLRAQWERAYFAGRRSYKFNGDSYPVFDDYGVPMTPQVCIDFITESLERASGMHWAPRGRSPEKVVGTLDFDRILEGYRRQEFALRKYARENPQRVDLLDYPMGEWVRYEKVPQFFRFVEREKDNIETGDVLVIRGRARWDHYREVHTHTFFVYESDPVTGMPMLLAGNSGKPRIVTWDGEMLRAPRRSIRHRIHFDTDWLYDHFHMLNREISGPPPLTVIER